jgi:hypothetical protein
MAQKDEEIMHESIHVYHRQRISDLEWALANSLAREKIKDSIIAELTATLQPDPEPTDS